MGWRAANILNKQHYSRIIVLNLQPPFIMAVFLLIKTMGENIMPDNKRQKLRRAILRDEFDTFITAGRLLKNSRAILGV